MLKIPIDVTTFGAAIRWAREKKGMTLRALAAKMGVSAPFLSDVERNRRHPLNVEGFANELGLDVDDLRLLRLDDDAATWMRQHPELAALLRRKRPIREQCYCPWCRARGRE